MSRGRNLWISLVAACLALLLVYGVYEMQLKQVQLQQTVRVIVPETFIPMGTMITKEMVKWKSMMEGAVMEDMTLEMEEVVGMETLMPLGANEPILAWKLDKFNLLPAAKQATFQIPKAYILSVSSGIRAGDIIALYVSGQFGGSRKLFAHGITVASVKSAANVEVDDIVHSNLISRVRGDKERMYASRREANGMIDHINLNLTEEEWLTIDRLCKDGSNKLVVAFTSASIMGVGE